MRRRLFSQLGECQPEKKVGAVLVRAISYPLKHTWGVRDKPRAAVANRNASFGAFEHMSGWRVLSNALMIHSTYATVGIYRGFSPIAVTPGRELLRHRH